MFVTFVTYVAFIYLVICCYKDENLPHVFEIECHSFILSHFICFGCNFIKKSLLMLTNYIRITSWCVLCCVFQLIQHAKFVVTSRLGIIMALLPARDAK
jgi:hypothetical protein